jgi:predicted MFS family arabinose efflux permease
MRTVRQPAEAKEIRKAFLRREVLTIYLASHLALGCVLISLTVLPVYVKHVGGSDFAAGLQGTVFTVGGVVMRFFLGPLADRRGRLLPLRIGAFVFMTAPLLIWAAGNLWLMAAARIYQAVGLATYLASASSYVTDITPDRFRGTALGIYRMIVTFSMMVGPPVSMWVIQSFGYDSFFVFYALVGGGAFLGVMSLPPEPAEAHGAEGAEAVKLKDIRLLFENITVRSSYVGILVGSAFNGILLTYIPIYVERVTNIANPALYFTIYAGIGALGAAVLGRLSDRYGRRIFILPTMLSLAAGLLLLAALQGLPTLVFIASALLAGIGYNAGLSLFISRVVDGADRRMKATALAFQESSIDLGISLGIFLFGLVSGLFAFPLLFTALAVIAAAAPVLVLRDGGSRGYDE